MDASREAKQSAGRVLLHYPTLRLTTLAYLLAMVQTQHHKTADGASIAYRIHGSGQGTPLVLIMGLSGVMDDWSPLVEELAKSRKGEWSGKGGASSLLGEGGANKEYRRSNGNTCFFVVACSPHFGSQRVSIECSRRREGVTDAAC